MSVTILQKFLFKAINKAIVEDNDGTKNQDGCVKSYNKLISIKLQCSSFLNSVAFRWTDV